MHALATILLALPALALAAPATINPRVPSGTSHTAVIPGQCANHPGVYTQCAPSGELECVYLASGVPHTIATDIPCDLPPPAPLSQRSSRDAEVAGDEGGDEVQHREAHEAALFRRDMRRGYRGKKRDAPQAAKLTPDMGDATFVKKRGNTSRGHPRHFPARR